jgi:hypothetical protein
VLLPLSCPRRTLPQSQCRWLLDNPLNGYCNSLSCCSSCSIFKPNRTTICLTLTGVFSQSSASIPVVSSRCFSSMPLRLPDFVPPLNGYPGFDVDACISRYFSSFFCFDKQGCICSIFGLKHYSD